MNFRREYRGFSDFKPDLRDFRLDFRTLQVFRSTPNVVCYRYEKINIFLAEED